MSDAVTTLTINADTSGADAYVRAMQGAEDVANKTIGGVTGMTLAVGSVGVAFVGAVAGLRSFFDYVGNQNKQLIDIAEGANRAGMSTKEFQETLFSARASGMTEKDFVSGLDKIGTDLTAASQGVTQFGKLFEANGISIKDQNGQLLSTKAALADIAGLMQNASPQVQQEIAKIVGLSQAWIPFLRQGVDGIEAQKKAAADLGIIIDDGQIQKAKEFNSEWQKAIAIWDTQFKAALVGILPMLIQLATVAANIINGIGSISDMVSRWITPDDQKSKAQLDAQIS